MTNNQLESDDIRVDYEMDVDCDIGQEITCYIETWFDVDSKFHVNTDDDDIWLNMYAKYNPFEDTLICRRFIINNGRHRITRYLC